MSVNESCSFLHSILLHCCGCIWLESAGLIAYGNPGKISPNEIFKAIGCGRSSSTTASASTLEMDKIRARGFLKYTYNYSPSPDVEQKIESAARQCGVELNPADWRTTELTDLEKKEKLLLNIGKQCSHFVPNSKLHKMKTIADVTHFYETPTSNITKYAAMARSSGDQMPKNLSIMEHHRRFHPNDKSAPHGGITAFPGELGKVLGLRNQRLYREYKPKKHWYEFEDVVFDYDVTCTKGMPWDPEVAKRMDSYTDVKFVKDHLIKKF
uniref:Large ribosomal subunit protein mL50 n=1 Tax=Globodera rostochiensis TaxID=31243 RepID=A0A914HQD4_GLORO